MKTITIKEGCSTPVCLGEKGENGVGAVLFDYSEWLNDFGNGAISLLVKRKGDTAAYPVVLDTADGIATWTISDIDTAVQGYGKAEYIFTIDDKVAKSAVFSFFVAHDLGPSGDPPDPYESWIDTLTALGGETLINAQAAQAAQEAAETAQTAAETAATNAATSATNAAQFAGAARDMAASALSSADSASASATAASGHATAAETAKDLAISAAEDAQHSETQAELSASAAAESAESASGSATSASESASVAVQAVTTAASSASVATQAAQNAGESATTATNAATSATQSAQNASQSASAASGSASAAATSESNAAQSATSAAASATEAATEAAKLNNYLPTDTASGSIASFSDGADNVPVEALTVQLEPIQSGSGTPSPDNVRPITGHTQAQVWREATYDTTAQPQITIPLGQTVYGGSLDVVGGKVVVDRAKFTFSGSESWGLSGSSFFYTPLMASGVNVSDYYITENGVKLYLNGNNGQCRVYLNDNSFLSTSSDMHDYLTSTIGFVYKLATPITIDLTPEQLTTLLGTNNIWSDSGDVDVTYRADIQKYITKVISEAL